MESEMSDQHYQPISCELHDVLESAATLRKPVAVIALDAQGVSTVRTARITDIFGRDGVEYLVTDSGETIRLDALVEVDGLAFKSRPSCGSRATGVPDPS
jgi:Rho-binding antiterminator